MNRMIIRVALCAGLLAALAGCEENLAPVTQVRQDASALPRRAMDCLKRGIQYEYLSGVRAQAAEALQDHGGESVLPWLRNALRDESVPVRFAAALSLGARRDKLARSALEQLRKSSNPNDRIAATYGLHRLGISNYTGQLVDYLRDSPDVTARSNAALVLGRIGGANANRVLVLGLSERNPAVRANVLEAMALQGSPYAIQTLHDNAYGGIGAEEVFAINVLGQLRDRKYATLFRSRLEASLHLEAKLAAARALGLLGDDSGYTIALDALRFRTSKNNEADTAKNRMRRVHGLAAQALGAIRKREALPALEKVMNDADDPRTQIAAAKAILDILRRRPMRLATTCDGPTVSIRGASS